MENMKIDKNIWTSEAVTNAVIQGNPNLEIILTNYFEAVILRIVDFEIDTQNINDIEQLNKEVLDGIEKLEDLRKEFLSVVQTFAASNNSLLTKYLPSFFERLLNYYEERGINLYTGTNTDVLRNDHFRFFNQFLIISITEILIENCCFDTLRVILHTTYNVYDKSFGSIRKANFIRFRAYNYTLNEFLNTGSPKKISVTADYIRKYSSGRDFEKFIKADILLYYISLWHHVDDIFDVTWFPELSVYNREKQILPQMASKSYFENAKILFGVETIEEYKQLLSDTKDTLERYGLYRVPDIQIGLLYDTVGSLD